MDYARMLFITCDIESLIEQPDLISDWSSTVAREIGEQKPDFASIHLQGLKTNGRGAKTVELLVKDLDGQASMDMFSTSRAFYDLDNLGLCSIYYMTDHVKGALFDNKSKNNQSDPVICERFGFLILFSLQNAFSPYFENMLMYSTSGTSKNQRLDDNNRRSSNAYEPASFMMCRWLLFDKPFTFINLSLSKDHSLLDGVLGWPAQSCNERRKELQSLIDSIELLFEDDAVLLPGNYNCSLNKERLLKDQIRNNNANAYEEMDIDGNLCSYRANDLSGSKLFTITSDTCDLGIRHDWLFGCCNGQLVKKYEQELNDVKSSSLREPNIFFSPTFPYAWDVEKKAECLSRHSWPSWKNRILMNKKLWNMMHSDSFSSSSVYYGLLGKEVNIGAHKPIFLVATVCVK